MNFRQPEGQDVRWIECLQQYDLSIEHRPGSLHGNADALSRRPCLPDGCRHCDQLEDRLAPATSDRTGDNDTHPQVFRVEAVSYFPEWSKSRLQDAQCQDGDIGPIVRWLKGGGKRLPWPDVTSCSPATKGYWAQWDSLCIKDGLVFRLWETPAGGATVPQLLLPKQFRQEVLHQLHNTITTGHLGVSKTLGRVREQFYWIGCQSDVQDW